MSQEHNQNVINNDHIIRINFEDDEKNNDNHSDHKNQPNSNENNNIIPENNNIVEENTSQISNQGNINKNEESKPKDSQNDYNFDNKKDKKKEIDEISLTKKFCEEKNNISNENNLNQNYSSNHQTSDDLNFGKRTVNENLPLYNRKYNKNSKLLFI